MACNLSSLCRQVLSAAHKHDEVPGPHDNDNVSRHRGRLTLPDDQGSIGSHGSEGNRGSKGGQREHTPNVGDMTGELSTDHLQQADPPLLLPPHAQADRTSSGRGTHASEQEPLVRNGHVGGGGEPRAITAGTSPRLPGTPPAEVDATTAASTRHIVDVPPGGRVISGDDHRGHETHLWGRNDDAACGGVGDLDRESNIERLHNATLPVEQRRLEKQPWRQEIDQRHLSGNSNTMSTGASERSNFEAENASHPLKHVEPGVQGELGSESRWPDLGWDQDLDLAGDEHEGESIGSGAPATLDQLLADKSSRADIESYQNLGPRDGKKRGDGSTGASATLDQLLVNKSAPAYADRRQGRRESNDSCSEDALGNRQIDTLRKASAEPREVSPTQGDVDTTGDTGAPYTPLEMPTQSVSHVPPRNRSEAEDGSVSQNRYHQSARGSMPAESTGARAVDSEEGAQFDGDMLTGKNSAMTADGAALPTNHDGLPEKLNPLLLAVGSVRGEAKLLSSSIYDPPGPSSYNGVDVPTTVSKEDHDPYGDEFEEDGDDDDDGGNWSTWLPQAS